MPRRTTKAQEPQPATPNSVTVRMYNGGFGDTFLLTFTDKNDAPFYMLIDCGVHFMDKNGKARMQLVAEDIAKVTRNRINLLAVTHEHTDHLFGFMYAQETFQNIQIDELWLPWTEDPTNTLANELKKLYGTQIAALKAAITKLKASNNPLAGSYENILAFEEPPDALGMRGNSDILKFLRSSSKKTPEKPDDYRKPGEPPLELPNVTNIKVYVLGPPADINAIKKLVDPKEMYLGPNIRSPESDFNFAVLSSNTSNDKVVNSLNVPAPFDKSYCMSKKEAFEDPFYKDFFKKHYGTDGEKQGQPWRRIDNDWLSTADELALSINSFTNNTSLVLAIELTATKPGKVLLFAADAQVGNWLSWQNLEWQENDDSGKQNEAKKITGVDLLNRTVFYKVGHHGSRNATLQEKGLEMMQSSELVAFISVDEQFAKSIGWHHPEPIIVEKLTERARGRVIRSDKIPTNDALEQPEQISDGEWKAFLENLTWDKSPDKLWIQYTIS